MTGAAADVARTAPGADLVGRAYRGPFDELDATAGIEHRVVAWDMVAADEGTGIVHIATGCGAEDFELGRELGLPTLVPVDEAGCFTPEYGFLAGLAIAIAGMTASTLFQQEQILAMRPGETVSMRGYDLRFEGITEVPGPNYRAERARFIG